MYLAEYLKLRGVNANALTTPEAKLLGVNVAESGWVGKFANIEIPESLAELALTKPGKNALKEEASRLLFSDKNRGFGQKATHVCEAPPATPATTLDQLHHHEAIDRCDLFARMVEDNLLSHPAVQANAAARELIEAAITSLAEAYQVLCQDQGD